MNGRQLRDDALAGLEQKRFEWIQLARGHAVQIAKQSGRVSINELREVISLPEDHHPNTWGAVLRCKDLEPFTFGVAKHAAAHARVVRYYRLAGGVA
jgi:hypothetical protein